MVIFWIVPFLKYGPPSAIISQLPPVLLAILDPLKLKESALVVTPLGHEYDKGPAICLAVVSLTSIKPLTSSKPDNNEANPAIAARPSHLYNKSELRSIKSIVISRSGISILNPLQKFVIKLEPITWVYVNAIRKPSLIE
jgi:hypothetical protein